MQWSIYSTTMMCSLFFLQDNGESLIFQLFAVSALIERKEPQTVLVVCPFKSIIEDQIAEAKSMGIPAASAVDISKDEFRAAKLQLIFGLAETVLESGKTIPWHFEVLKTSCNIYSNRLGFRVSGF